MCASRLKVPPGCGCGWCQRSVGKINNQEGGQKCRKETHTYHTRLCGCLYQQHRCSFMPSFRWIRKSSLWSITWESWWRTTGWDECMMIHVTCKYNIIINILSFFLIYVLSFNQRLEVPLSPLWLRLDLSTQQNLPTCLRSCWERSAVALFSIVPP